MKKNKDVLEQLAIESKIAAWDIIIKQVVDKTPVDDPNIKKDHLGIVIAAMMSVVLEGYLSYMKGSDVATILYFLADTVATAEPGKEMKAVLESTKKRNFLRGEM